MLGSLCAANILRENNKESIEELWNRWTHRDSNTYKVHGDSEVSRKSFKEWGETILEKPIHPEVPLSKAEIKRLKLEMKIYDKNISSGKFVNTFEDVFFVQEGISLKDPVARFFYKELNEAIRFERVQRSRASGLTKTFTYHMREAYINNGLQGRYKQLGVAHFKEIQRLQHEIMKTDNVQDRIKWEKKLEEVVDVDELNGSGALLNQFKELMKMSEGEFRKDKLRRRDGEGIETQERYDPDVYQAANAGRQTMNEMGSVMVNGLNHLLRAVKWKTVGTADAEVVAKDQQYRSIEKKVNEAIGRIQEGRKQGGYLPGYIMTDMIRLKESMDNYMNNNSTRWETQDKLLGTMERIIDNLHSGAIPEHARPLNNKIRNTYNENPLFILEQYANDAITFNKLQFTQAQYLETMKRLSEAKDIGWVKGMRRWIDEEFQISTEGLSSRPNWMNESSRALMGLQVARTMGLNFGGAVTNGTAVQFASAKFGYHKIKLASHDYLNGVAPSGEKMKLVVDRAEAESGFLFNDVATELVTEGLMPAKGTRDKGDYSYNIETGQIEYKGSPALDRFKAMQNWTIEKGLVFHRFTENWTRKYMFRTAFMDKYREYAKHPEFVQEFKFKNNPAGWKSVEAKAQAWALEFVGKYGFEYAIHAKPKASRGIPAKDTYGNQVIEAKVLAGYGGQLTFDMLHYPFSLMQQQSRDLRGAARSLRVGQWNSAEATYLYRYAGLFAALSIGSVLTNLNLHRVLPNETLESIKQIEDNFTTPGSYEDEEMNFGLLSEVTGPTVGTMKFLLMYFTALNTDPSYLQEVILGNVDYEKEEHNKYKWYQLSTEVGRYMTKVKPAIEDGRGIDIFRHYFKLYPGELPYPGLDMTTRQAREIVGSKFDIDFLKKKPDQRTKGRRNRARAVDTMDMNVEDVLQILDKMR